MSKSRLVRDEIWSDHWFFSLSPTEKIVWFFLLTNERNNIAGIYKMSTDWGQAVTRLSPKVFKSALKKIEADGKILRWGEWVVILNHVRHQSLNPSVEQGIHRVCNGLPSELYDKLSQAVPACPTLPYFTLPNLSVGEDKSSQEVKKKA